MLSGNHRLIALNVHVDICGTPTHDFDQTVCARAVLGGGYRGDVALGAVPADFLGVGGHHQVVKHRRLPRALIHPGNHGTPADRLQGLARQPRVAKPPRESLRGLLPKGWSSQLRLGESTEWPREAAGCVLAGAAAQRGTGAAGPMHKQGGARPAPRQSSRDYAGFSLF